MTSVILFSAALVLSLLQSLKGEEQRPAPLTQSELQMLQDRELRTKYPDLFQKMVRRMEFPLVRNFNPAASGNKGGTAALSVVEMNVDEFRAFDGLRALLGDCESLEKNYLMPGAVLSNSQRKKLCRVSHADFYLLNEADSGVCRSEYHSAEELAMRMNLNIAQALEWFEIRADLVGQQDGEAGCKGSEIKPGLLRNEQYNALLSRFPIRSARRIELKNCHDWYEQEEQGELRRGARNALVAEVEIPETEFASILVVVTHLENKTSADCRQEQLAQIDQALSEIESARGKKIPVLLGGDMNSILGTDSQLKNFMKERGYETDPGFSGTFFFGQSLDFIFTRRTNALPCFQLMDADVVREAGPPEYQPVTVPMSDHAAVIADFPIRCSN
jgi:endonuclease/exonuclease/phosphatase family metal-dependent hydrolase